MHKDRERRDQIIDTIVTAYLETGEPVSSGYVAARCALGVSSPTVRNIMKDLERSGYLSRPHTSAGCIPTVICYRYYVKHLMPSIHLEGRESEIIQQLVENAILENNAGVFMEHVASVISEITDLIGVTMTPLFDRGIFNRFEIVSLGGSRYLLILSLKAGLVKTINVTVREVIPLSRITESARLISERLHGLTIAEIKRTLVKRMQGITGGDRHLFDVILNRREEIFAGWENSEIHVAGLSRFLSHSDLMPENYSYKLVDMLEHKQKIADTLFEAEVENKEENITIGGSGVLGTMPPLSLVSSAYRSGSATGVVAVIGPTRIWYPRLLAVVKYTALVAAQFFHDDYVGDN